MKKGDEQQKLKSLTKLLQKSKEALRFNMSLSSISHENQSNVNYWKPDSQIDNFFNNNTRDNNNNTYGNINIEQPPNNFPNMIYPLNNSVLESNNNTNSNFHYSQMLHFTPRQINVKVNQNQSSVNINRELKILRP